MSFGKRPTSAAIQPPAQPTASALLPETTDLRNGHGEDIAQSAVTPSVGAGDSLIQSAASINAKLEEGKRRIDERLARAQTNAQAIKPDALLRPFFLIPDTIWTSDLGAFLLTSLDLSPYDDWNVVFLAADDPTAAAMDIALHPNGDMPTFVAAAEKLVGDLRAHMKRATDEVEVTADYATFQDIREDAQLRVKGLAMSFARTLIDAWEKRKASGAEAS
jgi:hypothetical protein